LQTYRLLTQLAPAYLRRNKSVNAWRKPAKYPGVLNQWTQLELAQTLMNRGIVDNISASSVGRFLNQEDLKPHRIKYWLNHEMEDEVLPARRQNGTEHRICFVYTPTLCSWLNQVEIWFGILSRRLLKRGSFASTEVLN
jgi:hypothetical protein